MQDETHMTIAEHWKYLGLMRGRYLLASRAEQSRLLNEMHAVTGMHRKTLLRLLHAADLRPHPRTKQPGKTSATRVDDVIRLIWESLDSICAEPLTPALLPTAPHLAQHCDLVLTDQLPAHLEQISIASVQRRLTRFSRATLRLPRRRPEQANRVARAILMRKIAWDECEPGHFAVDPVHHGGSEPKGASVYTLQMIDVATLWSERVAVLGAVNT